MFKKIKNYNRFILSIGCIICIHAQSQEQNTDLNYGLTYISELQYNITDPKENKPKWANLLSFDGEWHTTRFWKNGMFKVGFWSIKNSFDRTIVDDLLIFSNIDSPSQWLLCSTLGYQHTFGRLSVFAGIRDANTDYFISECELFFTNSSAGTPPTISLNSETGLYPLTAMGIHLDYRGDNFKVENSFYNNLNSVIHSHNNIFKFNFNPFRYGFVNFTQTQYLPNDGSIYTLGTVIEDSQNNDLRYSVYAVAEKDIINYNKSTLRGFATLGFADQKTNICHKYIGIGTITSNIFKQNNMDKLGIMCAYAQIDDDSEFMAEMSYSYSLNDRISLQPTFHYINNTNTDALVGLLRATFYFGND